MNSSCTNQQLVREIENDVNYFSETNTKHYNRITFNYFPRFHLGRIILDKSAIRVCERMKTNFRNSVLGT